MSKTWARNNCDSVKELDSLEVTNKYFVEIIDSLIKNEQECSYFNEDIIFIVDIQTYTNDTALITINLSEALSNNSIKNAVGYFNFKRHLFLVTLEQNYLLNMLFYKTKDKNAFKYNPKDSVIEQLSIEDDTLPTYTYFYSGDKFVLDNGYPPCSKK